MILDQNKVAEKVIFLWRGGEIPAADIAMTPVGASCTCQRTKSFVAQSDDRIDPGGAARRNVTGEQCHGQQQNNYG